MNQKGSASVIAIVGIIITLLLVAGYLVLHPSIHTSSGTSTNQSTSLQKNNAVSNTPVPSGLTELNVDSTLNQENQNLDQSLNQVDTDLKALDQSTAQTNDSTEGL